VQIPSLHNGSDEMRFQLVVDVTEDLYGKTVEICMEDSLAMWTEFKTDGIDYEIAVMFIHVTVIDLLMTTRLVILAEMTSWPETYSK